MKALRIINGRVIDPSTGEDGVRDVCVVDGKISAEAPKDAEVIDAKGKAVTPGWIDLHVHLREPGQSAKETIATGTRAAAAGGFTSVVCMPNTQPALDNAGSISWVHEKARRTGIVNVFVAGALTKGIAGEELTPVGAMVSAGIVALTDDGHCIQNHEIMRRAVEYARMFNLPVFDHCQDYALVGDGVMHEGEWSYRLGLPGWPRVGEELIVARNILLAELCDHPIHCQHISSGGSVRMLREARARGIKISGEACPHHVVLTDASLKGYDSRYKMNPPLRTQADIESILEGIADGTIDILCSDHAPHAAYEKERELGLAPFGITGLETEFGLFCNLLVHERKVIDFPRLIALYTTQPARLLSLDRGTLAVGAPADITICDPDLEWTYDREQTESLSKNTPFHGWSMKGRAVQTIVGGRSVWTSGSGIQEPTTHV